NPFRPPPALAWHTPALQPALVNTGMTSLAKLTGRLSPACAGLAAKAQPRSPAAATTQDQRMTGREVKFISEGISLPLRRQGIGRAQSGGRRTRWGRSAGALRA